MKHFLVKIANSNVMSTYKGFCWYPYLGAQVQLVACKKINDAIAVADLGGSRGAKEPPFSQDVNVFCFVFLYSGFINSLAPGRL